MNALRAICVYCGANAGDRPDYADAARRTAAVLAARDIELVYGGGSIGLMGVLADAALAAGGRVVGVIPQHLNEREIAHAGLSELHVVHSMHERKALMMQRADAFIALPGGLGTLEELFEILTWAQLGLHRKPVGLLDVRGYFDPLLAQLDRMVEERFLRAEHRALLTVAAEPEALLERFAGYRAPGGRKWLDLDQT